VRTRAGSEPIHELELELLCGDASALFEIALELAESVSLRPAVASKAERGLARLTGLAPAPRKAEPVVLAPDATVDDAVAATLGECQRQILANRAPSEAGDDPEGVHQLRVGIRRLRSALGLFKSVLPAEERASLRDELRWVQGELGPARDLDVFLAERIEPLLAERGTGSRAGVDAGALKRLRDEAAHLRAEAYAGVRAALGSARFARLLLRLGAWQSGRGWREQPLSESSARLFAPAHEFARELLESRARKAHALGVDLPSRSAPELHALRIRLKKLRYAADFLQSLFPHPKRARRYLRRLARLQDTLGHLNDVAVAERLLAVLLERLGSDAGIAHQRAAGFATGWAAHSAHAALADLPRRFERFAATPPFFA
jgi:CHAD domain-containing protein